MRSTVLTDDDVRRVMPMSAAVDRIASALREHAEGTMVAPPRFRVDVDKGALLCTAGAVTHDDKAVGFRVDDRFQERPASHGQVVVVFDRDTGDFKGVIVGGHLGAMRTGAIGGVAIKHMARPDASRAAILGSGRQARTHLEAAAVVRHFASVTVYSPHATNREAFAREMRETLARPVDPVVSAHEAVADAEVVMCVTTSPTPVFDPRWLTPGAHVNTVGPRAQGESAVDASIAGSVRVVATDSRRQLRSDATPSVLAETPWMEAMVDLGDLVMGQHTGRHSPEDMTLFCTAGLSGTEVAVASEALRRAGHREGR
jgi:ornithine cyclodeaminase/alanine dehydrogenase-like protein (mu-crystallin family)